MARPCRWTRPVQPLVAFAPAGPAAGRVRQQRADRRRRVEQAQHAGTAVAGGDRREQRLGHAEDHHHDVHHVGAEQLLPAARVAQAFDDAPQARPGGVRRWRHGPHQPQHRQGEPEADHVHPIGRRQPEARHQQAPEGRPADHPERHAQRGECRGGGHLLAGDQPGQERLERGALQPVERGGQRGDHEQDPDPRAPGQRVDHQHGREQGQAELGELHHAAPVVGVGQRPTEQAGDQEWSQLGHPEQADHQRRPGELVDLERDRDVGDHAAREAHHLPNGQQSEVPMVAQWSELDGCQPQPARPVPPSVALRPRPLLHEVACSQPTRSGRQPIAEGGSSAPRRSALPALTPNGCAREP